MSLYYTLKFTNNATFSEPVVLDQLGCFVPKHSQIDPILYRSHYNINFYETYSRNIISVLDFANV